MIVVNFFALNLYFFYKFLTIEYSLFGLDIIDKYTSMKFELKIKIHKDCNKKSQIRRANQIKVKF